jgi:hypothetical protein
MKTVQKHFPAHGVVVEFFLDPAKTGPGDNMPDYEPSEISIRSHIIDFVGLELHHGKREGRVEMNVLWRKKQGADQNLPTWNEVTKIRWAVASVPV